MTETTRDLVVCERHITIGDGWTDTKLEPANGSFEILKHGTDRDNYLKKVAGVVGTRYPRLDQVMVWLGTQETYICYASVDEEGWVVDLFSADVGGMITSGTGASWQEAFYRVFQDLGLVS